MNRHRKTQKQKAEALQATLNETISRRDCQNILDAIYDAQRTGELHPLTDAQHLLEGVLG